jgi:hypothetical protein
MFLQPVIDLLRQEFHNVTIYDCGKDAATFCLAVRFDEPIDLYYLGRAVAGVNLGIAAQTRDGLIYFPEALIDAETYAYILKE